MNRRPIIDAGPGLNFFSLNKERLLVSVLGPLSMPETVYGEILRKARSDTRFGNAEAVLRRLVPKYLEILSDDVTPALSAVVARIGGTPMADRLTIPKDLGELMVVSHAVVAAESGSDIVALIDETAGAELAASEQRRLGRLGSQGRAVGSIQLVNTATVLEAAAGKAYLPDRAAMRDLYKRMRSIDNGLVPISKTRLLSAHLWM